jgi:predicted AAA+ superfamily ATPase
MVVKSYPRLLQPPPRSFFLFGIRGSGKTSWSRASFPDALHLDLLDEQLFQEMAVRPAHFAELLGTREAGSWVLVDEVQRLPGLLNYVHKFIEERRLRFILAGSSTRKLYRAGVNLLGGRALVAHLYPFVPEELGADFDLEAALRYGTLPIVWIDPDPEGTLRSYTQLFLKEEIRAEALVRNFAAFARFFQVAAVMNAQTLNVSRLSRDAGVSRTTLQDHLNVMMETHVLFELPAWEAALRVRERKRSKLYWADPGLARAAAGRTGPVATEERGPLFEGWMAALLRTYADQRGLADAIYYWAPHQSRVEVDFLLKRGKELLAIEAKTSPNLKPELLAGLRAASGMPGLVRRILVYGGSTLLRTEDGIDVWPVDALVASLAMGRLWPA